MSETDPQESIRQELEDLAFEKAKTAGLATLRSQIKVNLKITVQVFSNKITESDWKKLTGLDVGVKGLQALGTLKATNNEPCDLYSFFGDWHEIGAFKNRIRAYAHPLYVGTVRGGLSCIKKRLLS